MNTYRLHIDSDLQGPWSCIIKAANIDDAIRYGEQVYQDAHITVVKIDTPPQKKPEPEPDITAETSSPWGFSRRELATITAAVLHFAHVLEYSDESEVKFHRLTRDQLLSITECEALAARIKATLTMEQDMDGPF